MEQMKKNNPWPFIIVNLMVFPLTLIIHYQNYFNLGNKIINGLLLLMIHLIICFVYFYIYLCIKIILNLNKKVGDIISVNGQKTKILFVYSKEIYYVEPPVKPRKRQLTNYIKYTEIDVI